MSDASPIVTKLSITDTDEIDLALSGGAFRAALFHLGVVRYLWETKRIKQVKRIYSVSGGSILAAFMALNWEKFTDNSGSSDKLFNEASQKFLSFVQADLRGRVFRRWILSRLLYPITYWITRERLLTWEYNRFFREGASANNKTLRDLSPEVDSHILATSFTSGVVVDFGKQRAQNKELGIVTTYQESTLATRTGPHTIQMEVGRAVAASSAFPPAFPAMWFRSAELGLPANLKGQWLTDGGVYDNLGIQVAAKTNPIGRVLIVSDAGRPFQWSHSSDENYSWIGTRTVRMTDIQMDRIATADKDVMQVLLKRNNIAMLRCDIGDETHEINADIPNEPARQSFPGSVQRQISQIRTDLNYFSNIEIHALTRHGFEVAKQTWERDSGQTQPATTGSRVWIPRPLNANADIEKGLAKSHRIPWGLLYWRDIASWALACVFTFLLLSFLVVGSYSYINWMGVIPSRMQWRGTAEAVTVGLVEPLELQTIVASLAVERGDNSKASDVFLAKTLSFEELNGGYPIPRMRAALYVKKNVTFNGFVFAEGPSSTGTLQLPLLDLTTNMKAAFPAPDESFELIRVIDLQRVHRDDHLLLVGYLTGSENFSKTETALDHLSIKIQRAK